MTLLEELRVPYKLKEVERKGNVQNRLETTAEHTFSSIWLAEYFLKKHPELDELKVLKLILYHDFCEIHSGDHFILDKKKWKGKEKLENDAVKKLLKEVPNEMKKDLQEAWEEYSAGKTKEARFAKAIDALDAVIQVSTQPKAWIKYGFTEKKLREYKEPQFKDFPLIMNFFNEIIEELKLKKIIPRGRQKGLERL